uniref:Uncharacterized protein n=1 Tax=Tetranychus urticae TaxID=32264 RepID=T1L4S4_TETUR
MNVKMSSSTHSRQPSVRRNRRKIITSGSSSVARSTRALASAKTTSLFPLTDVTSPVDPVSSSTLTATYLPKTEYNLPSTVPTPSKPSPLPTIIIEDSDAPKSGQDEYDETNLVSILDEYTFNSMETKPLGYKLSYNLTNSDIVMVNN